MGAVYSVEAKFLFRNDDPTEFCRIITEEIRARDGKTAHFSKTGSLTDPFECFSALCPNAGKGNVWYADFTGRYGWEWVMCEIFEHALSVLEDGSYVRIEPDNGWERFYKENGVVCYEKSKEDEDEEDDEDEEEE